MLESRAENVISGEVEIPFTEMMKWTKLRKDGEEIEIYDDILCRTLVKSFNFFVNGDICWFYSGGVFIPDINGSMTKTLIRNCIPPKVRKDTIISRVYRLLLSDHNLQVKDEELNNHPSHWINTLSGMFDPIEWKNYDHDPKYRSVNQIPHPFTGEKPAEEDGKDVNAFMEEAIPDKEDRTSIYEFTGNSCSCDCRFRKAFAIQGQSSTGKSTVLRIVETVVGDRNISHIPLQKMEAKFYAVHLIGKTVNMFSDLPAEDMPFTGNFKAAIDHESINDSFKGKDQFSFKPYTKCWFSCNELPKVSDTSDGFYNRLLLISMNVKPKKPDPQLIKKLTTQKSINYFLYQSIKAYSEALKRGHLTESKYAKDSNLSYRKYNDPIEGYMSEHWERTDELTDRVPRTELYKGYEEYCSELDIKAKGRGDFYEILRQKGYRKADKDGIRYFGYLKYKPVQYTDETDTDGQQTAIQTAIEEPKTAIETAIQTAIDGTWMSVDTSPFDENGQ